MSAATDLSALAAIADVSDAAADRLIRAADPAQVAQVLRAALSAAGDPGKYNALSAKGKARLQKFAARLARHANPRGAATLSGLGGHSSAAAMQLLYPTNRGASRRKSSGLGSWLSEAFHNITGTRLSNVAAPILGAVATAVAGPVAGAVVTTAARGASSSGSGTMIDVPNGITGPVLPANQSAHPPGTAPVRPAGVPADWQPSLYGTTTGGLHVYQWAAPRQANALVQAQPAPAANILREEYERQVQAAQAQQSAAPAAIDPKLILYGALGLGAILIATRR